MVRYFLSPQLIEKVPCAVLIFLFPLFLLLSPISVPYFFSLFVCLTNLDTRDTPLLQSLIGMAGKPATIWLALMLLVTPVFPHVH